MAYGSKQAWLPAFVMDDRSSADQFRSVMEWIIPRLIQLERLIRPRYWPFWRKQGDRIIGIIALILAIVVTLPIPLGNWLPAFSTALLGLALSERDGILFAIGGRDQSRLDGGHRGGRRHGRLCDTRALQLDFLGASRPGFPQDSRQRPTVAYRLPLSFLRHCAASHLKARASSHNKQRAVLAAMLETARRARISMADLIIVYWRDIPAQVIVKKGRQNAKRELPLRFTEAIDMCAMRTGAGDTDDYLAEWRKADPVPVADDLEAEADKAAGRARSEL